MSCKAGDWIHNNKIHRASNVQLNFTIEIKGTISFFQIWGYDIQIFNRKPIIYGLVLVLENKTS